MMGRAAAQDIYFCSDYTIKGEPIGAAKTWNLDTQGRYVYILFSNHNKRIKSSNLVMNLLKQTWKTAAYKNYEKRVMKLQTSGTWAVLDYQFIEPGSYEVIVKDKNGNSLATNYITVILKNSRQAEKGKDTSKQQIGKDPDRSYYNAKTIFCRSVVNDIPTDTGSVFRAGEVNVEIINDKALASDSMTVDVFKKGFDTEKFPIYVTSKNFRIDAMQNKAFFVLTFDQTGEYRVMCYNRRSQMISVGFVTIR